MLPSHMRYTQNLGEYVHNDAIHSRYTQNLGLYVHNAAIAYDVHPVHNYREHCERIEQFCN